VTDDIVQYVPARAAYKGIIGADELLWRPPAGSSHQAAGLLDPFPVSCELYPEGGHPCIHDGVRSQEVKQHLHMDGDMLLNKAFNHSLRLVVANSAAGPQARMQNASRSFPGLVEQHRTHSVPFKGKWSSETGSFIM
jgi:hypothetical protein